MIFGWLKKCSTPPVIFSIPLCNEVTLKAENMLIFSLDGIVKIQHKTVNLHCKHFFLIFFFHPFPYWISYLYWWCFLFEKFLVLLFYCEWNSIWKIHQHLAALFFSLSNETTVCEIFVRISKNFHTNSISVKYQTLLAQFDWLKWIQREVPSFVKETNMKWNQNRKKL